MVLFIKIYLLEVFMDDFFKKIYTEITNIKENAFLEEMHMISDWGDVQ